MTSNTIAESILNKQLRTADMMWSSSLIFGRFANKSSLVKTDLVTKRIRLPRAWTDPSDIKTPRIRREDNIKMDFQEVGNMD